MNSNVILGGLYVEFEKWFHRAQAKYDISAKRNCLEISIQRKYKHVNLNTVKC